MKQPRLSYSEYRKIISNYEKMDTVVLVKDIVKDLEAVLPECREENLINSLMKTKLCLETYTKNDTFEISFSHHHLYPFLKQNTHQ